jgi:hypothetical protein
VESEAQVGGDGQGTHHHRWDCDCSRLGLLIAVDLSYWPCLNKSLAQMSNAGAEGSKPHQDATNVTAARRVRNLRTTGLVSEGRSTRMRPTAKVAATSRGSKGSRRS